MASKKYLISLVLMPLLFLFLLCLSPIFWTNAQPQNTPDFTLISHRGAAGLFPENTLAGVQKALDLKVDRIEIDVHQTKDSVLVLMHDITLNRTTNGQGKVKHQTYEELQNLEVDLVAQREKIPTLEEIIKLVNGRAILMIEVKKGDAYYSNIEQRIVDLIHQYNGQGWCYVMSFDDRVIEMVDAIDDSIVLYKLFVSKPRFLPVILSKKLQFKGLESYEMVDGFCVMYPFAHRRLVERVHALDKTIFVWTLNDTTRFKRLLDLGVDGVITDRPDLLVELK